MDDIFLLLSTPPSVLIDVAFSFSFFVGNKGNNYKINREKFFLFSFPPGRKKTTVFTPLFTRYLHLQLPLSSYLTRKTKQVTEVSAPSAYDFAGAAEVSTFTRSQLLLAERALLRELDYYLYHPTSSSFSSAYLSVTLPHLKKEGFVGATTADDPHSWEEDPCEEITEIVDYLLEASVVSHASLEFAPSAAAAAAIGYTLTRVYNVSW